MEKDKRKKRPENPDDQSASGFSGQSLEIVINKNIADKIILYKKEKTVNDWK